MIHTHTHTNSSMDFSYRRRRWLGAPARDAAAAAAARAGWDPITLDLCCVQSWYPRIEAVRISLPANSNH